MNRDKDVDLTFSFDAVERWSLSNNDDDTPVTDTALFTTAKLCEQSASSANVGRYIWLSLSFETILVVVWFSVCSG